MTRAELLLTIAAEECSELAVRLSKAARFTPTEVMPGQPHDNAELVRREMIDLMAVYEMLVVEGVLPKITLAGDYHELADAKKIKVAKYARYSRALGVLTDGGAADPVHPMAKPEPPVHLPLGYPKSIDALCHEHGLQAVTPLYIHEDNGYTGVCPVCGVAIHEQGKS